MEDRFGSVEMFARAWMAKRLWRPPFKNAIHTTDIAYAMCIFRQENYQVELYICKPNTETTRHSHPNVESLSLYLTGNLSFAKDNGDFMDVSMHQEEKPNGTHKLLWARAEENKGTPHALRVGKEGGAFLIFERWLDGEPSSVTVNWEGEYVGEEHVKTVENSRRV